MQCLWLCNGYFMLVSYDIQTQFTHVQNMKQTWLSYNTKPFVPSVQFFWSKIKTFKEMKIKQDFLLIIVYNQSIRNTIFLWDKCIPIVDWFLDFGPDLVKIGYNIH